MEDVIELSCMYGQLFNNLTVFRNGEVWCLSWCPELTYQSELSVKVEEKKT